MQLKTRREESNSHVSKETNRTPLNMARHPGRVKTPIVVTKEIKIPDFPHLCMSQMLYFEKFI